VDGNPDHRKTVNRTHESLTIEMRLSANYMSLQISLPYGNEARIFAERPPEQIQRVVIGGDGNTGVDGGTGHRHRTIELKTASVYVAVMALECTGVITYARGERSCSRYP
jgi:hypothetical protein